MIDIIQASMKDVTEPTDKIILIVTPKIDDIWIAANELNIKVIRAHHGDDRVFSTSRYFPMLDHIGSAKKKTIGWHDVSLKYKEPRRDFYTKTVKTTAKIFTSSCFSKSA